MSEPDRSWNLKPDTLTRRDAGPFAFDKQSTSYLQGIQRSLSMRIAVVGRPLGSVELPSS
jgi:hypothetical protein